jgi:hypothetical protein
MTYDTQSRYIQIRWTLWQSKVKLGSGCLWRLCINTKESVQVLGLCKLFITGFFYGEGLLTPRPTPKLEVHPLLSVRDCLFNISHAYRLLVGKPEGKRWLGRPRRRWVDNIRMDLGEVGWGDVDWIGLAKDRNRWRALVKSVLNLWIPGNAGKLSSGLTSSGLSGRAQLHIFS